MGIPVRFTRGMAPYNAGDVAGFDEGRADELVRRGYATREIRPGAPARPAAPATPVTAPAPPGPAAPAPLPPPPKPKAA